MSGVLGQDEGNVPFKYKHAYAWCKPAYDWAKVATKEEINNQAQVLVAH